MSMRIICARFALRALIVIGSTAAAPSSFGADFKAVTQDVSNHTTMPFKHRGYGMSANGLTIVGGGLSSAPGHVEAYRWTPNQGLQWLGFFWPPDPSEGLPNSIAYSASGNGSVVVGTTVFNLYHVINLPVWEYQGFRWTAAGSPTTLPWLSGDDESYPLDVSNDGSIAVGMSYEVAPWLLGINYWAAAVQWTNGSPQELDLLSGDDDGYAVAVSDNGSVIVGQSGELSDYWRPAVWVNGTVNELGRLTTASCSKVPYSFVKVDSWTISLAGCDHVTNVSGDGSVAVGQLFDGTDLVPVYWSTSTRQPSTLPLLPNDSEGAALCASSDGMIIGGHSGGRAVIWDRSSGGQPQRADAVLQAAGLAPKISGWQFLDISAMSSNGKIIAGRGKKPNGQQWVWWADLEYRPVNGQCSSPTQLNPSHQLHYQYTDLLVESGSTQGASSEAPSTCAGSGPNVAVWYSYEAPVEGYLYLDMCESFTWLADPYIAVYSGCPAGTTNEIYCSNDCPSRSDCGLCVEPPHVHIQPNQKYYVAVGGRNTDPQGHNFSLRHQFLPINDHCDDAMQLSATPSRTSGVTTQATPDSAPTCYGVTNTAAGVWYKVIGTGALMTASTCDYANFDTKISVYCSGCGGMTCVSASDDEASCGLRSSATWCSSSGTVYHVLVHGYQQQQGAFHLRVTSESTPCLVSLNCHPQNESCGGAVALQEDTTLMADNTGADTSSIGAGCYHPTNTDVWFSYRTACDSDVWIDTCQASLGSLSDTVLSVYSSCDATSELACNDDYADSSVDCGVRSAVVVPSPPNSDLMIRVSSPSSVPTSGTFPIRVQELPRAIALADGVLPDARQGTPYLHQLQVSGGCPPYFFTHEGMPSGLSVDYNGILSGTAVESGFFVFTVHVNDGHLSTPGASAVYDLYVMPGNDDCASALPITEDGYHFGNYQATTDGPVEHPICNFYEDSDVGSDVWFNYTSSCEGVAVTTLCGSQYDTKMAVYDGGSCPDQPSALACNDDSASCGLSSELEFRVQRNAEYLLRVGGHNGAQGDGVLIVSCFDDCNETGVDDLEELNAGLSMDCNHNLRPDECDFPGDISGAGLLSLGDFAFLAGCLSQPCTAVPCTPSLYSQPCCSMMDFDADGDVDLRDLREFQLLFAS